MNEQQMADLFSDQIDRILQGDAPETVPDVDDLQALLDLSHQISNTQFQASSTAQAAFLSQLTGWFGALNGGSPMTILGLSKAWFISIIVTVIVVVTGAGFLAFVATSIFVFDFGDDVAVTTTPEATGTTVAGGIDDDDDDEDDVTATSVITGTPTVESTAAVSGTATVSATLEASPVPSATVSATPEATGTPPPVAGFPTIIIQNQISIATLCQGLYLSQSTLVNYGLQPVDDAALVWEVIEGEEFVDGINIDSDDFIQISDDDASNETDDTLIDDLIEPADHYGFTNFNQISVNQEVDLDIGVEVGDSWWEQPDGTEIKVKIWVQNSITLETDDDNYSDHDRGHGNDPDGHDEDNPGNSRHSHDDDDDSTDYAGSSQIITIVKQGAEWITLSGVAHRYDAQTWLVDGNVVVIDDCTGLPATFPPGSDVNVIGLLQPDGTFIAINITVININIVNGDFDSGAPPPSSDSGDDDDDDGGGGGRDGGGRSGGGGGGDDDDDDDD